MAINNKTKRTIQLYIDHKEIDGSVRSIRDRIKQLTAEMNKLTVGTSEYQERAKKIAELNTILADHKLNIGKVSDEYVSLTGRLKAMITTGIGSFIGSTLSSLKNKLSEVFTSSIEAYQVQEEAERKLETVMRQRMNATDAEIQQMKDLASEQQKIGVIGDEVQMAGMQQVATFLKEKDSIATLLPAMNDLLAQQKGLNVTQQDAQSIGNMFGKVMQGETSALKRVGISFSEAQEKILQTGNEQERAAMLAQIVTENVGHMNAELAKTDAGRAKQAANDLGDLSEEIGAKLMPLKAKAELAFATVISGAIDVVKWMLEHKKVIMSVAAAIAVIYAWHLRETVAIKAKTLATRLHTAATIASSVAQKAWTSASLLAHYAITLITRGYTALRMQMIMAKTAGAAIAWGPMALAITGVGLAIYGLIKAFSGSKKAADENSEAVRLAKMQTEDMADIQKEAARSTLNQKNKVEQLTAIVRDNTAALNDRWAAAKELEKIVPGYHASLQTEGALYKRNEKAIADYIAQLDQLALAKAIHNKLVERMEKQVDIDTARSVLVDEIEKRRQQIGRNKGKMYSLREKTGGSSYGYGEEKEQIVELAVENEKLYNEIDDYVRQVDEKNEEERANQKELAALQGYRKQRGITDQMWIQVQKDQDFGNPFVSPTDVPTSPQPIKTGKSGSGNTESEDERLQKEIKEKIKKIEEQSQAELTALKEKWYKGELKSEYEYNQERNRIQRAAVGEILAIAGLEPAERVKMLDKMLDLQLEFGKNVAEAREKEIEKRREFDQRIKDDLKAFHDRNVEMQKEENEKKKAQLQSYNDKVLELQGTLASALGEAFDKMFQGEKDAWREFLKSILVTLMDAIEKQITAYYAAIMAKEVATKGWAGVASAAAQLALITTAFEAAKSAVKSFDTGGFTGDGAWDEPKGVVHAREFVANRFATQNRQIRPVLNLIDAAQRSGSVSRLTADDIAAVLPTGYGRSQRSRASSPQQGDVIGESEAVLMATLIRLGDTVDRLKSRLDKPITAETYITGRGGSQEAQSLYDRMRNNVNRKSS